MSSTGPRPWVAYVGPFEYPWGRAASRRVHYNALAIAATGRDVVVLSAVHGSSALACAEPVGADHGRIMSADVGEFAHGNALSRAATWTYRMGARSVAWLDAATSRPTHVIVYGGSFSYMWHVTRWARRERIPVLIDVVEWYDPSAFKGGRISPLLWTETFSRWFLHRRAAGVITISSYLERYYQRRGLSTARIPPGTECLDVPRVVRTGDRLSLIYAGTPGKKDDILSALRAVEQAAEDGTPVELTILGPSRTELSESLGREPANVIATPGRLDQEDVRSWVAAADFTILLRPDRRSSHAGFPTKYVESISVGTPVIANITSDLAAHLVDGATGLVVGRSEVSEIVRVIKLAATMSLADRQEMRRACLSEARSFHWERFASEIDRLLLQSADSSTG